MDNPFKKSNRRPEPILIPDSSSIDDPTGKMIIRTRQPKIDERVLGWAKSIDEATGKEVRQLTGISMQDRDSTHFYIVGASGTGKTKFLEYLMMHRHNRRCYRSLKGQSNVPPNNRRKADRT